MKRVFSLLICILLVCILPVHSNATKTHASVMDYGNILSSEEELLLESEAEFLKSDYGYDVVILTVESLNGQHIESYADDFYDSEGYADDGVILVLAMSEREWYISTCGDVIYALTDYGISDLGDIMLPYLSDGQYYEAFHTYLECLPEYFDAYLNGTPVDGYADYSDDYYHGIQEEVIYYDSSEPSILMSVLIGLVAAGIVILIMRGSMNTRRPQSSAASYLKSGSYHLRTHQDLFLYSNVSKIRRQENNSGSGSSVHRSSGGRRHGGGGGRF